MEEVQAVVDEQCKMSAYSPVWSHCFGSISGFSEGRDLIIHAQSLDEETLDLMAEKGNCTRSTINFMPAWLTTFPPKYGPKLHDQYPGETVAEKDLNQVFMQIFKKAKDKNPIDHWFRFIQFTDDNL